MKFDSYPPLKRLIIKLLIFFLIVAVMDAIVGNILRVMYFSQKSGTQYRTTYSLEQTDQDIIILGPSTASHHYIPKIFEDSLNLSCYNAGRDGNGLLYNLAIQKSILKRYKPKLFILDIRPGLLSYEFDDLERLSSLLPYYHKHPEIRPIIAHKSRLEQFKLISQTYPFNSLFLVIFAGNFDFIKSDNNDYSGYIPLNGTSQSTYSLDTVFTSFNYSKEKISILDEIVTNAVNADVPLIIIDSPGYKYIPDSGYYKILIENKVRERVFYWSYLTDPTFTGNIMFFRDRNHLNHEGALYFTQEVVNRIKQSSDIFVRFSDNKMVSTKAFIQEL